MHYRKIKVPIAINFAWNFSQNGIFGAITSGYEKTSSVFTTKGNGPETSTGGQFGPEGSIQAVSLCSIVAIFILIRLYR